MALDGARRAKIREALLDAFKRDQLLRLVTECMDVDFLQHVSAEKPYKEQVFEFVEWVDQQGLVQKLIDCALREAPRNRALQELAESAASWQLEPPTPAAVCPYKGLEYYDEVDKDFFFGREALTATLLAYLRDHRFLAVIGASGSGKSSVVRAGIVPALRKGEAISGSNSWHILVVTPTGAPLRELANKLWLPGENDAATVDFKQAMLASADALSARVQRWLDVNRHPHLVLVVDQFEELFTLRKGDDDEERQRIRAESAAYIDNLLAAAAPGAPFTLILTLRADFYDRCADFPNLAAAVADEQFYIVAMTRAELYSAIVQPALLDGWELEDGLPEVMLDEVASEPAGSLPLLSVALEETWKRRRGSMMTLGGYQEAGGVRRAIATKAEQEYARLSEEEQAAARTIFVRLTELGEGSQDTRRRVPRPALLAVPAAERVLQRLQHKDVRLVSAEVQGEATYVDVTHEALIREWTRLRQWLDEDRDGERYRRRLDKDAEEWNKNGRHAGLLYPEYKLQLAQEWIGKQPKAIDALTREFIDESQRQLDEEKRIARLAADDLEAARQGELAQAQAAASAAQELEAVRTRELRQARLARTWALSASAAMLLVAFLVSALAFFFYQQYQSLEGERLLQEARQRKQALDPYGAIDKFTAAVNTDPSLQINLSEEISDTLRYVATTWAQEGESLLLATGDLTALAGTTQTKNSHQALFLPSSLEASSSAGPLPPAKLPEVAIEPAYLQWAVTSAPSLVSWVPDLPMPRREAIISATAIFSQALALAPPSDTPIYVWIEPGMFLMGSSDRDNLASDDEMSQHLVSLGGYWVLRTEVTYELYRRCVDAGVCDAPKNTHWDDPKWAKYPVTDVDWQQTREYAAWVGGRLPTEAEWEKACRGDAGALYPWGDEPPTPLLANYEYAIAGATSVGQYSPGMNSLYDMSGNMWERTSSLYSPYPYNPDDGRENQKRDGDRVMRGGSWGNDGKYIRCAARFPDIPTGWNSDVGFRIVSPGF